MCNTTFNDTIMIIIINSVHTCKGIAHLSDVRAILWRPAPHWGHQSPPPQQKPSTDEPLAQLRHRTSLESGMSK